MHMIFLVRHGQTEWNKALVFRGRKDIPLSTEGKTQAARTGKYLGRRKIYRIFTSPMKHTRVRTFSVSDPYKEAVRPCMLHTVQI
jgi:broad specificity phosphatase PhoE